MSSRSDFRLELTPLAERFATSEDVRVRVRLVNAGSEPAWALPRLAVGFEDGIAEVSFTVQMPSGAQAPFMTRVNVGPPRPEDRELLAPGAGVERVVELGGLHLLSEAGTYEVTATYAADGAVVRSSPARFQLEQGDDRELE